MRVEVFSDKFVTKGNPSGKAVVETDDPKARKLLGEKVLAEILGGGDGGAPVDAGGGKKCKTR